MKRKVLALLMALVMALSLLPGAALAEGEEGKYRVEPTPCGGCTWEITSEGELRIYPTEGESGELESWTSVSTVPWYSYRTQITSVRLEAGTTATTCLGMFYGLTNVTSMDLSGLDTSSVTDMKSMFFGCKSLTSLDLSGWNTSSVTDMAAMFYGCSSLTSLDVSRWDTSNVTNMNGMFANCSSLASLDVSRWNTSNVTNMGSMFKGCSRLTSLDVGGFDTSNVTSMNAMFNGCSRLTSLDVSRFNTSRVTDMSLMFLNNSELTSLDVSGFDTSRVEEMGYMFAGCSRLTSLDVSGFGTSNVKSVGGMFLGCKSVASLDLSDWDTNNVTNVTHMGQMFLNLNSDSYLLLPAGDTKVAAAANAAGFTHLIYNTVEPLPDSEGKELPLDVYAKKVFNAEPETPEEQDFLGWSTEKGGEAKYAKGATIPYSSSTTLNLYPVQQSHTWDEGTVTKEPTCGTPGEMTYTCSAGGESRTETIPATGNHTWDAGRVTTQPTYSSTGVKTYTCTVCGETKTETIPALVYVPVTPVTPVTPATPSVPSQPGKPALNTQDHVAYIIGYADGTVRPEGTITRAEVATIFFRLLTDESRALYWSQTNRFEDVKDTSWYNNAVSTLDAAGIIVDSGSGLFRPNEAITRAEFAAMAAQFTGLTAQKASSFTDVPANYWAAEEIALVEQQGWINGYPDGTFRPDATITRAEAMAVINRMLERAADTDHMLPTMVKWTDNPVTAWYYEDVQEATNSHEYVRLTEKASGQSYCYEDWQAVLKVPDWEALEKAWSTANSK